MHDVKLLEATLDAIVLPMPKESSPKLCADAGYKGKPALQQIEERNYRPHVKTRKNEADNKKLYPNVKARRWVVERTHSWFNRFRKILVSFEKSRESFLALLCFAAAIITWRQMISIHG